jgi:CubicO group peptidase (beta-lactamase class C family)
VRKRGDATPVKHDDQFHLGSCTKSITALLAGMMVQEGKLRWESTLAEVLPDQVKTMQPELRKATLEHLLSHRAGLHSKNSPRVASLKALLDDGRLGTTPREQRRKFVELYLQDPLVGPPGKQFVYSNPSFITAGVLVETVANQAWEDLMRERIFKPLGMTTAGFGAMGVAGKIDQPWQHRWQGGETIPVEPGPWADNPPVIGPAGTVHCSAEDWAKYAREQLRGRRGKSELAKQEIFERLHTPPFGGNYAGGWGVTERTADGATLNHNGSNNSNFAVAVVNTTQRWAVIVMTNQAGEAAAQACSQMPSGLLGRATQIVQKK